MDKDNRREGVLCAILAAAAFVALAWRASAFFPNASGLLGHDYAFFFPMLVTGHFWQQQNGWLALPHFTPAFCGGVPFLSNPQSVFYSIPQLLMLGLEPTQAMSTTLLLASSLGAAGCYVLLRSYFAVSGPAATLGAALFLLNEFIFRRMIVGHLTYHAFFVAPLLVCSVASAQSVSLRMTKNVAHRLILAGLLGSATIAYVVYSGALTLLIPVVLTAACTLMLLQMARGFRLAPWVLLAASCLWGALLSAVKLGPSIVLASQFPRTYLPAFLFDDPVRFGAALFRAFFMPGAMPDAIRFPSGWALGRHEFELGVSVVPLLLLAAALYRGLPWRSWLGTRGQRAALTVLLLVPIAVTFGPPQWGNLLLEIPVINNNTTLVRWWAIYMIPLLIISARCFDLLPLGWRGRTLLLACCLTVAIAQGAAHEPAYYTDPAIGSNAYDARTITNVYREVRRGSPLPRIERIGFGSSAREVGVEASEAFILGASAMPCYEPLFGYDLEMFPDTELVDGPTTLVSPDQRLNLVDASSYLGRRELVADWRFHQSRRQEAEKFAAYRPYEWDEPWWHAAARHVTAVVVALSLVYVLLLAGRALGRARAASKSFLSREPRRGG